MEYNEYDKKIREIISKPDTAMAEIGGILESLKADLEGAHSVAEENAALKERVRDLQDTNARLFLGQTSKPSEDKDEPEDDDLEGAEALNAFVEKMTKEE